jgi:hypothetical protein
MMLVPEFSNKWKIVTYFPADCYKVLNQMLERMVLVVENISVFSAT